VYGPQRRRRLEPIVRGGTRNITGRRGARVPPPPKGIDNRQKKLWRELAGAVEELGTFMPSDLAAFRSMVRSLARAEACPLEAPPSAAAKLESSARGALESFGLTPRAREKVTLPPAPPPKNDPLAGL
jgi:hypothetical protein